MRRQPQRRDMGEAISIEDALSLLTVVFVLFILFLVPLVNIDRMRLVQDQGDEFLQKLAEWIAKEGTAESANPYATAFGLDGHRVVTQKAGADQWIEALNADGTLTVIEHQTLADRYTAMVVKGYSSVVTWRHGTLRWSGVERIWFTTADSLDYGNRPESKAMRQRLEKRTKEARGF